MPALVYKFQGQEHRFQLKDLTSIGRGRDNDVCVPCESISGVHAVITRDGHGYQLEDTGSSNGILVGGRRVLSCLLAGRVGVRLGRCGIRLYNGWQRGERRGGCGGGSGACCNGDRPVCGGRAGSPLPAERRWWDVDSPAGGRRRAAPACREPYHSRCTGD